MQKNTSKKEEIIGSETVIEKIKTKIPWIFGNSLRKPKINFPRMKLPRISLPMPSRSLSIVVVFAVLFFLQMGVVYLIVRGPSALGATQQGDPVFIYQDIHDSYIIESIVAAVLIFFCSTGFIMLYQASKYVYNKKMAIWILVIGLIMLMVSFIILQYIISIKAGTIQY